MFTFTNVPTVLHGFLIPLLQAWIDRKDQRLFRLPTTRYGLVSFTRTPWPPSPVRPTVVSPAGEQDANALQAFAAMF